MPLLFSGEYIQPEFQSVVQLTPSPTIAYGKYLAASCTGCHHSNFEGGAIPGVPPSWPKAANLTQKGNLRNWKYADFKKTLTTGITPEGKKLNPQYMPWPATAAMNDTELSALFLFLKSLPNAEADTP
jgi:hypothetical protein